MGRMASSGESKAILIAIVGTALIVLIGGLLASTAGLLFVAGITAAAIGLVAAGSGRPKPWIQRLAIGLGLAVVVVGAIGTWVVALAQGGSLGLVDFLWATSGLLVPAEAVVTVLAAAWGARAGPISG